MRKLLAANWKMHLTYTEAQVLLHRICAGLDRLPDHPPVVFAVPYPYLLLASSVAQAYAGVQVAAQNVSEYPEGAYTGEVSAAQLKSCGVAYVIVGHSERRQFFLEDDSRLLGKLKRALDAGLRPIFCVGETLQEREAGQWQSVLSHQINRTVLQLPAEQRANLVLAYEPVWAIGTGHTATPAQAAEVHDFLRSLLGAQGQTTTILYGGSVKPGNAAELFAEATIDGGLVGGASLDAESFLQIVQAQTL